MAIVNAQEALYSVFGDPYQVFLSFRGPDTRTTFVDHLYTALVDVAEIRTFKDDEGLQIGENISSELKKAIQESKISIIVFSKNYASSSWCLDELVQTLERKNTAQHSIIPVFYHVEPFIVRYRKGSFDEAFAKHEKRFNAEKVWSWKKALKEVTDLSGMHLRLDGPESKFITRIVEKVEDKLNPINDRVKSLSRYVANIFDSDEDTSDDDDDIFDVAANIFNSDEDTSNDDDNIFNITATFCKGLFEGGKEVVTELAEECESALDSVIQ